MLARLSRTERLFTRAQKLLLVDKHEEGAKVFEQAHTRSPTHTGISLHWALALSDAACFDKACSVLHNATKLQPNNPVLHMFLGQIHFDHENYTQALRCFQKSLIYDPVNFYTHGLMMLIPLAQGQGDEAYQSLTQPPPNQMGKSWQAFYHLGLLRLPSTEQLANVALQSRILLTVETYAWQKNLPFRSLSEQLIDQQHALTSNLPYRGLEMVDALLTHLILGGKQLFLMLRNIHNKNNRIEARHRVSADKLYYLCKTSSAISSYQQILQRLPESQDIKQRLVELYYEAGKFDAALATFKELTHYGTSEHNPEPSESLFLGELLYIDGQSDEAIYYLRQALESPISEFKHFYYMGLDELKTGRKVPARQLFAKALRMLNPDICRLRLDELKRVNSDFPAKEQTGGQAADTRRHKVCLDN